MTIVLGEITRDNLRECIELSTTADQEPFVATNVVSIAQAYVEPTFVPRAIYDGDTMVGFLMYGRDIETGVDWIIRLMVDARYQGQSYGRAAMEEVIAVLKRQPDCKEIYISYLPSNTVAERLYASVGFHPTGEIEHGEVVARLMVKR